MQSGLLLCTSVYVCLLCVHCSVSRAIWFFYPFASFFSVPKKKQCTHFVCMSLVLMSLELFCMFVCYVYTVLFLVRSGFFTHLHHFFQCQKKKQCTHFVCMSLVLMSLVLFCMFVTCTLFCFSCNLVFLPICIIFFSAKKKSNSHILFVCPLS